MLTQASNDNRNSFSEMLLTEASKFFQDDEDINNKTRSLIKSLLVVLYIVALSVFISFPYGKADKEAATHSPLAAKTPVIAQVQVM